MKKLTLTELKSEARDRFSYILVFCPNFPSGTKATTKTSFEKLIELIDAIVEQTKGEEAKQWLTVCLQEVRESWKYYDDGNIKDGRKTIQRAEEHFQNAFARKTTEARFVAGETDSAFDNENGFPE